MSLSRRLLDLARANLNALLDRAAGEGSIEDLSDEELETELARRRERRLREQAERRSSEAAEEEARQRGRRGDGARRPRSGAAGSGTSGAGRTSNSTRSSPGGQNRRPTAVATLAEQRVRELYLQLEVPYGAPFAEVKKSFRQLMRKYHPDLHVGDPKKHQVATELTMSLTQAYKELEAHLATSPKRGASKR